MKKLFVMTTLFGLLLFQAQKVNAHCEIPCGIYGDKMRIDMINEHIDTIEKSMKMITELSKAGDINYNQLVRWVSNKDDHATKLQHIVTQYFLTQRIKLVDDPNDEAKQAKYDNELALLHEMLVYAMKTKQTTDLDYITKLRETVKKFSKSYFGEEEQEHLQEHHE